ncbi:hypothetical protein G6F43_003538 [Rhizopus delemar]|nr:hypothetical protein G6F43_003538 [Rhizopus delemar]
MSELNQSPTEQKPNAFDNQQELKTSQEKAPTEEEVSLSQSAERQDENEKLPNNVRILKEAFPDVDIEVIEAILQTQNDDVESSFDLLLGMTDPQYQPTPPPMPPRPQTTENGTYWNQQQINSSSIEDQLRRDEEYAKKIAMEDERRARDKRHQQQRKEQTEDDSIFNFQEELPIIKEKVKEAGNAAKRKMLDFYNQLKASRNNNNFGSNNSVGSSSIPATNAHYKGLSSDDGDDLLVGDISALHLSDYDVYAKTSDDIIHVNPPPENPNMTKTTTHTSTSDAQLKADEDFARQLAEEEKLEARRRRRQQTSVETSEPQPPQMPPRKQGGPTVVIAPKSPLELGDSDYEDVGLNAASSIKQSDKPILGSVPYVIGDDEDSDSDDDLADASKFQEESSFSKLQVSEHKGDQDDTTQPKKSVD